MKKLPLLLFAFITLFSFGQQDLNVFWSDAIVKESSEKIKSIHQNENGEWIVVKKEEENKLTLSIDQLDSNGRFITTSKVSIPNGEIESFGVLGNQSYIFVGSHDVAKSKSYLHAYPVSAEGVLGTPKELVSAVCNGGYHAAFDISISPNHAYLLVLASDGYSEKQKEILHTRLFDKNLGEVMQKELITSIESAKRRINVAVVNNNGTSYLIKKDRVKGNNMYYLFVISSGGADEQLHVHLKARQIADMDYLLDANGSLYLAGFYASALKYNFEGMYIAKFEETARGTFSKEYLFNENVIDAFKSKKEIKDLGYGLDQFSCKHFILADENNLLLTAEHHTSSRDSKGQSLDSRKGFVVINFDKSGGFRYATPIVSDQSDAVNGGYWGSHGIVFQNQSAAALFNRIGSGGEKVKVDLDANKTAFPLEVDWFNSNGLPQVDYLEIPLDQKNWALNAHPKNRSNKQIICLETQDQTYYTFGVLNTTHE